MTKSLLNLVVDRSFDSKRELRGVFSQRGNAKASNGVTLRPSTQRLLEFERVAYQDTVAQAAFNHLIKATLATAGPILHPDAEIAEYLNWNIRWMEDELGNSFEKILSDLMYATLWGGFSVSEKLYELQQGRLLLGNVVTYHPTTIMIYPDRNGMLRDGKPSWDSYRKSGIYQNPTQFLPETRLPLWKLVYVSHQATFGNYYGRSMVASFYKWFRLKEILVDMMATALDRFGNPLLYVKMPPYPTEEVEIDPATGEERALSTLDLLARQIQNLQGGGNVVFLPQPDGTNKPEIGSLTTGNNIGQTFIDAIQYCNEQMVMPSGVPFFLLSNELRESGKTPERRMEAFHDLLDSYRRQMLKPILHQCFSKLIQYNFNRDSAKVSPTFSRVYSDRPEDRVASMQMIRGLTELGYFRPSNDTDFTMVRQMVRAAERELDAADKNFINDIFKKESPLAAQGGRPTGIARPQQTARPQTPARPQGKVTNRSA